MAKVRLRGDRVIWFIVAIFAMMSILAVFSAGSFLDKTSDMMGRTKVYMEQLGSVAMGFAALFVCYAIPYKAYRKISPVFFGITLLMLVMLYIPGIRAEVNGAVRGIRVGGHTLQVFEFVKVGLVMYLSWALDKFSGSLGTFKDFFLKLLMWVLLVCLLVVGNSFSTTLLLGVISMLMFFFMEVKWSHLGITVGGAIACVALLFGIYHLVIKINPDNDFTVFNRLGTVEKRIERFASKGDDTTIDLTKISKEEYAKMLDEERQSENAKIAIHEGGIFGKGMGKGTARYSLSMAFSDFIFASIVEETGFIGGALIILLYLVFLFRSISLSFRCPDTYSQALVLGLAFLLVTQAFLHILVNVRLLPITGHTLPLISHGGTAYLVLSGAFGIILSISRTVAKMEQEKKEAEDAEKAAIEAAEMDPRLMEQEEIQLSIEDDETDNN